MYLVDFIFQSGDIDINTILDLGSHKSCWGQYIDEPYIAIENVKLNPEDIQLIGERQTTIKIKIPQDIELITFSGSEEELEKMQELAKTNRFTFIGKCSINEWGGAIKP